MLHSLLTVVENKIPDISNLVKKKTDYNSKICEIKETVANPDHDKYTTTSKLNKLTTQNFAARLAQAILVTKTELDTKLVNLNKKVNTNKTRHLLVENELKTTNI